MNFGEQNVFIEFAQMLVNELKRARCHELEITRVKLEAYRTRSFYAYVYVTNITLTLCAHLHSKGPRKE